MKMPLKTLLLAAVIAVTCPAIAQTAPDAPAEAMPGGGHQRHPMSPEQHTERMTKELDLSPDQVSAVSGINNRFAEQMRALREPEETRQARRDAAGKLMAQHDEELRKVLNDTQYAKWEQQRREMKAKWQQRTRATGTDETAP
ncbi:MAG: hypothetical protein KBG75_09640 [Pseudomonadales bacterium]|nr:hypothetical protein [Pseudomonadales bacterium]